MDVSFCVATLGDPDHLAVFARSLGMMRGSTRWELLVCLNGRGVERMREVEAALSGLPVRLVLEPQPGKSRALNRLLPLARGELLAFTDDDADLPPEWLQNLVAAAGRHPEARVFGGKVLASGVVPEWIRRSYNLHEILTTQHDLGDLEAVYAPGRYPVGPNMAIRRAALGTARWPEKLGPGTTCPVGDETGFLSQLSTPAASDRIYVPSLAVRHEVEPGYFRLRAAWRRCYFGGYTGGRFHQTHPAAETYLGRKAAQRIRRIASVREFTCVAARTLGFFQGRLERARDA